MRSTLTLLSAVTLASATIQAQGFDFLYTTSQNESTLSGSGGTVLRNLHPNDIVGVPAVQCMTMAEKWLPRQGIITMAGDEDGDDDYWEPGILGSIDALIASGPAGSAMVNGRTVWYSPSVTLGTVVSGGPGLRPGDIGRIVRNGGLDGKVQHFIRQELINQRQRAQARHTNPGEGGTDGSGRRRRSRGGRGRRARGTTEESTADAPASE